MKAKKPVKYAKAKSSHETLNEAALAYEVSPEPMVRTQIYLSKPEYDFVQKEASRRDEPMAAVIRAFIDEKMEIPDDAWTNNPMLKPTVPDSDWDSPSDAAINHDHYLYGSPKKWIKVNGKFVEAPPLPEDYFDNPISSEAYDKMLREIDETK